MQEREILREMSSSGTSCAWSTHASSAILSTSTRFNRHTKINAHVAIASHAVPPQFLPKYFVFSVCWIMCLIFHISSFPNHIARRLPAYMCSFYSFSKVHFEKERFYACFTFAGECDLLAVDMNCFGPIIAPAQRIVPTRLGYFWWFLCVIAAISFDS